GRRRGGRRSAHRQAYNSRLCKSLFKCSSLIKGDPIIFICRKAGITVPSAAFQYGSRDLERLGTHAAETGMHRSLERLRRSKDAYQRHNAHADDRHRQEEAEAVALKGAQGKGEIK